VKLVDALCNHGALGVLPRAVADAIAGIDGGLAVRRLGADIGVPCLAAGAGGLGELLAVPVRAGEAAEVGALARPDAGDEEAHIGLLGLCADAQRNRQQRGSQDRQPGRIAHLYSSGYWL